MKDKRPRVVFIHSLNNYSGSPKVLAGVINAFSPNDFRLDLHTSSGDGFLSNIDGVRMHSNGYKWTNYKWITFFFLILSQCYTFITVCLYSKRNTVFYINTIIPFGAMLACRLTGKKMIVHIHEDMNTAKPLYRFCKKVVQSCVTESIFVSEYLRQVSKVNGISHVVYNGIVLPKTVYQETISSDKKRKVVLMAASLRTEKGVYMFAEIARVLSQYDFELVLSATEEQVHQFIGEVGKISNLHVFPLQRDMSLFYPRASVLLQLSQASKIVETYGLTIVEAMSYGVPAIVPNVGGPKEIIDNSQCGLSCDTENQDEIIRCIEQLLSDKTYCEFSKRCLMGVKQYTLNQMQKNISTIVYAKFNI